MVMRFQPWQMVFHGESDMRDPLEDDNDQNEVENVAEEAINDVIDDVEHVLVNIVDDL